MNRLGRLFGFVTLLQTRRYVPAAQLAAHFGIGVRTVYRDIRALGEQGVPVSFEAGRGYFLVPGYFLPPVSFTADEAAALLLLEQLGATLADQSVRPRCRWPITSPASTCPSWDNFFAGEARTAIGLSVDTGSFAAPFNPHVS